MLAGAPNHQHGRGAASVTFRRCWPSGCRQWWPTCRTRSAWCRAACPGRGRTAASSNDQVPRLPGWVRRRPAAPLLGDPAAGPAGGRLRGDRARPYSSPACSWSFSRGWSCGSVSPHGDHGGPLLWLLIFVTGAYGGTSSRSGGSADRRPGARPERDAPADQRREERVGRGGQPGGGDHLRRRRGRRLAGGGVGGDRRAGGVVGGGVARRLPPVVLRVVVVAIGLVAVWRYGEPMRLLPGIAARTWRDQRFRRRGGSPCAGGGARLRRRRRRRRHAAHTAGGTRGRRPGPPGVDCPRAGAPRHGSGRVSASSATGSTSVTPDQDQAIATARSTTFLAARGTTSADAARPGPRGCRPGPGHATGRGGRCSLGVSVDATLEAVRQARLVVAEINPAMPWTGPHGTVPYERIDVTVEVDAAIPEYLPLPRYGDRGADRSLRRPPRRRRSDPAFGPGGPDGCCVIWGRAISASIPMSSPTPCSIWSPPESSPVGEDHEPRPDRRQHGGRQQAPL